MAPLSGPSRIKPSLQCCNSECLMRSVHRSRPTHSGFASPIGLVPRPAAVDHGRVAATFRRSIGPSSASLGSGTGRANGSRPAGDRPASRTAASSAGAGIGQERFIRPPRPTTIHPWAAVFSMRTFCTATRFSSCSRPCSAGAPMGRCARPWPAFPSHRLGSPNPTPPDHELPPRTRVASFTRERRTGRFPTGHVQTSHTGRGEYLKPGIGRTW